jgi:hypothetical protein
MIKGIGNDDDLILAAGPPIHKQSKLLIIFIIASPSAHKAIKQFQEVRGADFAVWRVWVLVAHGLEDRVDGTDESSESGWCSNVVIGIICPPPCHVEALDSPNPATEDMCFIWRHQSNRGYHSLGRSRQVRRDD